MAEAWFVTGTDTGVGKTLVAAALLRAGGIRERSVHVPELSRCSRMWLINSVRGWRRATLVERDGF